MLLYLMGRLIAEWPEPRGIFRRFGQMKEKKVFSRPSQD
jgi:hypothetical protein